MEMIECLTDLGTRLMLSQLMTFNQRTLGTLVLRVSFTLMLRLPREAWDKIFESAKAVLAEERRAEFFLNEKGTKMPSGDQNFLSNQVVSACGEVETFMAQWDILK